MILQKIEPPYDRDCVDSDSENQNCWDVKFWENWINSVDFVAFEWSENLFSSSELIVTDGHRGVRIGKNTKQMQLGIIMCIVGIKLLRGKS